MLDDHHQVQASIDRLCREYQALPMVIAIALGGSRTSADNDVLSDIDFYLYTSTGVPISDRRRIAQNHARFAEIDNRNWEPGDEWIETDSGLHFDIMFRDRQWIEQQLDLLLIHHQPRIGYTTCLWFNVLNADILYDPEDWFADLQQRCRQAYPERLRQTIIDKNYPLLRSNLSSYLHQLELSVSRKDLISLQHRTTAFLASYFDIIFALNRMPHPGEKRLLEYSRQCELLPENMHEHIDGVLKASIVDPAKFLLEIRRLLSALDQLLQEQGFAAGKREN